MRMPLIVSCVSFALAVLAVWLWGAIGASSSWLAGSMAAIALLLVVVFSLTAWRSRWAGWGALTRGSFALGSVALIAIAGPAVLAKDTTTLALVNHADWWSPDGEGRAASAARKFGAAMARGLGAASDALGDEPEGSGSEAAPVDTLVSGPGGEDAPGSGAQALEGAERVTGDPGGVPATTPSGLSEGGATDEALRGASEPAPGPAQTIGALEEAQEGVELSVESALLRPEILVELAEGREEDKPPAAADAVGPVERVVAEQDERRSGAPGGAQGLEGRAETDWPGDALVLVPSVPEVRSDEGTLLWPTPSVPLASAVAAPESASQSLATLSTWVEREGVSEWERVRIAHDWLALHIALAPSEPDAVLMPLTRQARAELARSALVARRADSLGLAALLAEVLAPMGIDAQVVLGGLPDEVRRGAYPRAWSAVRVSGQWLTLNVAEAAGCVPSERCATPYTSAYLFAPPRAAVRHHIPAPGAEAIYGDVDRRALLRGPDLRAAFFAAGFSLVAPASDKVVEVGDASVVEMRCAGPTMVRATRWDASTASSAMCDAESEEGWCRFTCPAAGVAGGRVRVLGMAPSGWTWVELASWEVDARSAR